MSRFIDTISKYVRPYYYIIIAIVLIIIFSFVGYYGYTQFYLNKKKKFSNVANAVRQNVKITIYMFHVDWCPHCKKAMPEWEKFVAMYNGRDVNGYEITCTGVDCTNETAEIQTLMNKYNIESYPTVKMIKDGKTIDFESRISEKNLDQFIETMTKD